jgi:hypothetical protein
MAAAFQTLPVPIRQFLLSLKISEFSDDLGKRYGLPFDTISALAKDTSYLLAGLINPDQFQAELTQMGIGSEAAAAIIQELNEKIFKPLREEVKNAPPEESAELETVPAAPAPTPAPAPSITPRPMPRPIPPPLVPSPSVTLPGSDVPLPPPAPPAPFVPQPPVPLSPRPAPPQPNAGPARPDPKREELHNVLKAYGVDPYREEPE